MLLLERLRRIMVRNDVIAYAGALRFVIGPAAHLKIFANDRVCQCQLILLATRVHTGRVILTTAVIRDTLFVSDSNFHSHHLCVPVL